MTTTTAPCIGIDVAKATLEVALDSSEQTFSSKNDPQVLPDLVARLQVLTPELIVVEATGGYATQLVAACIAADLPIVVVNPRQVRDFAKARNGHVIRLHACARQRRSWLPGGPRRARI